MTPNNQFVSTGPANIIYQDYNRENYTWIWCDHYNKYYSVQTGIHGNTEMITNYYHSENEVKYVILEIEERINMHIMKPYWRRVKGENDVVNIFNLYLNNIDGYESEGSELDDEGSDYEDSETDEENDQNEECELDLETLLPITMPENNQNERYDLDALLHITMQENNNDNDEQPIHNSEYDSDSDDGSYEDYDDDYEDYNMPQLEENTDRIFSHYSSLPPRQQ
jgi:hypothetical protein